MVTCSFSCVPDAIADPGAVGEVDWGLTVDGLTVDGLIVDGLIVDEVIVDVLTVDLLLMVDELTVDELTVDELMVDELMVDELMVDGLMGWFVWCSFIEVTSSPLLKVEFCANGALEMEGGC